MPLKNKTYQAKIRWRDREGAGVEFAGVQKPTVTKRIQPVDLSRRVAELEAENAALQLKLLELTQRLAERPNASERAA